jgi:hypothetical protein
MQKEIFVTVGTDEVIRAERVEARYDPSLVRKRGPAFGPTPESKRFPDTVIMDENSRNRLDDLYTNAIEDHFQDYAPNRSGAEVVMVQSTATNMHAVLAPELIVAFKGGATQSQRNTILDEFNLEIKRDIWKEEGIHVAANRTVASLDQAIADIDKLMRRNNIIELACFNSAVETKKHHDIHLRAPHWHLRDKRLHSGVDAEGAWGVLGHCGKPEILVAVLDDGVEVDHPDLAGQILPGLGRNFFSRNELLDPRPSEFSEHFPQDKNKNDIHGTLCAGLIAANNKKANDNQGVFGVAPGCKLLPIRILSGGYLATCENLMRAFFYAATNADILSCSWSCADFSKKALEFVLKRLARGHESFRRKQLGTAVFFAAGNSVGEQREVRLPASFGLDIESVICVSAATSFLLAAAYSCRGKEVLICAPGGSDTPGAGLSILTSDVKPERRSFRAGLNLSPSLGQWTDQMSGTSAAAAIAAGVGALMLSANPTLNLKAFRGILRDAADQIGGPYDPITKHSAEYGYGMINAKSAVEISSIVS